MNRLARAVEINHYVLEHPRVDALSRGMVVAHLTDIHCGRWGNTANLRDIVDTVNRLAVDLVVLTGDYVCYQAGAIDDCSAALERLRMPAVATLGNHDHWTDAVAIAESLNAAGVSVLRNSSLAFEGARGHRVRVVGLDDSITRHHDVERAFAGGVSRGLGTATVPLRFRAWPELALFRLERGPRVRLGLELRTRARVAGGVLWGGLEKCGPRGSSTGE